MGLSYDERLIKKVMGVRELTYGEALFLNFLPIFEALEPKKGEVFYDVGCGSAIPVATAALAYHHVLAEVKGIELLDDLYDLA